MQRGFTLFEMLIVLAVVALLAALAMPMMANAVVSLRFRFARMDLERQLDDLSIRAFAEARALRLGGQDGITLDLPRGWYAETPRRIEIRADGVCNGGDLFVVAGSARWHYHLSAPRCRPVLVQ
jgi:general secretion pathway protein G